MRLPVSPGLSSSAPVSSASSAPGPAASYALASLRDLGQEAGLSERATTFTAESLRLSTRCTYDSRLAGFRKWYTSKACDPRSASLGCIADFFISLFDKNLSIASIRGYRSAIASVHKGFSNGSTVSNSPFLTRLFRSFFLKRPPSRSLVPSWSLPAVLKVLAEAPFEPLQKVFLCFSLQLRQCSYSLLPRVNTAVRFMHSRWSQDNYDGRITGLG